MGGIQNDFSAVLEDFNPWWKVPGARKALTWPVRRSPHRRLLDQLLRLPDRRAQVLLGPRQVGKTTLLKQLADDLLDLGWPAANLTFFDFEDFRLTRVVGPDEVAAIRPVGTDAEKPRILLFDEVHHFPRWDRWLKYAVDNQIGRIVVTDSAASLLREAGRESGLGRWDEIQLEGLTLAEFARLNPGPPNEAELAVTLPQMSERYFSLGGFPAYAREDDYSLARERLRDEIVDRALRRDLGARISDPEQVRKLFVFLVQHSGSEQNVSDRAADLGVDRRTVTRWIDLLQDTFLLRALPRQTASSKASARLRGRSKIYAADHGLINAFTAAAMADSELRGRVFETAVYRHLREIERARHDARVSYLRWGDHLELDFLVEIGGDRIAVEVTHSVQPKGEKRRVLMRAAKRAGARRSVLIHGGLTHGEVEGAAHLPIAEFLHDPLAGLTGEGQ